MTEQTVETLVRNAWDAYGRGDIEGLLAYVDPHLTWTYLDPSEPDPQPAVCHGRDQLRVALQRQADQGPGPQVDEIAVHGDRVLARKLSRRFAELGPVVRAIRELEQTKDDLTAARELAAEDASFATEAEALATKLPALEARLTELLLPRDPHDGSDVVLEVKSGEGGEESALFAGDLLRMYLRYAERRGWKTEMLDGTDSELGGFKDVTIAIKGRGDGPDGVWARLKFEAGVHRVQRVPVTESQGRVHTSAAGVLVYPEPEDVEVEIDAPLKTRSR
jgi:peptide chain release factor 1